MSRDRIEGYIRTTVLLAALVLSSIASYLVPSPYRETAFVVDPLLDRIPASSSRSEQGREARATFDRASLVQGLINQYRNVN